jgi:hypothetical protein
LVSVESHYQVDNLPFQDLKRLITRTCTLEELVGVERVSVRTRRNRDPLTKSTKTTKKTISSFPSVNSDSMMPSPSQAYPYDHVLWKSCFEKCSKYEKSDERCLDSRSKCFPNLSIGNSMFFQCSKPFRTCFFIHLGSHPFHHLIQHIWIILTTSQVD